LAQEFNFNSEQDYYYHPWLEYPYYKSEMQGPLPPNSGTDDYVILFNAVGPYPESHLGSRLCLAGDQNNDGYDDIIAYCNNPPEVWLYFGGDLMDTIPDVILPTQPGWGGLFSTELADLNGDDDIDIVHGWEPNWQYQEVYVYYGGTLLDTIRDLTLICDEGSSNNGEGFGYGMSCGDVNGDDFDDLTIGAPNYTISGMGGGGKIFIYYGGSTLDSIPDFTITSAYNNFGGTFGFGVSISGDINNDGFNDIISIGSHASGFDSTGVYLFYGNNILDSIPDWTYQLWYAPYQYSVWSGSIIEDLNNDGYDEIAVITFHGTGMETHLFFGSDIIGEQPDLIISGSGDGPRKVKTAGDINADGFNDMIMGGYDNWVKIYYGGNPMNASPDISFYMPDAGIDVGFAGDVNNDGIHDFMFYANDDALTDAGQIFIYSDPSLTPHVKLGYEYEHPSSLTLDQNFPNPFNGVTIIPFQSNINGRIELNIYNILGQTVYFNSFDCTFGESVRVLWDGKDLSGNILPSGLYFAELIAEDYREAIKMEILR
jgi:hypothetical protein